MSVINYLTDTDLYKLTMMQAVLHKHPDTHVAYKFKCRNGSTYPGSGEDVKERFMDALSREVDHLCTLRFREDELSYLSGLSFFKEDFLDYLKNFQLKREHVLITKDGAGEPCISVEGPWVETILFEVPLLAIVSELFCSMKYPDVEAAEAHGEARLRDKVGYLKNIVSSGDLEGFSFVDMGTRRRFSFDWQEHVIREFINELTPEFAGTSNVYLAMKYGVRCIGTMAHEWLQAHQRTSRNLVDFQKDALNNWLSEYEGKLGIALSDVVGFNAFLKDFDKKFADGYDGARHDSGDPFTWCRKLIRHYRSLGIDPRTKTAIFSDGLNFETAVRIHREFASEIKIAFGIGTWLTNDMGFTARQFVIKMTQCNGLPVAKVSDSVGKATCEDPSFEEKIKSTFLAG